MAAEDKPAARVPCLYPFTVEVVDADGTRHLTMEWGNTPRGAAFFAMAAAAEATERAQEAQPADGDWPFARAAFATRSVRVWHGRHDVAPNTPPCLDETPPRFAIGHW